MSDLKSLKEEINNLKEEIRNTSEKKRETTLKDFTKDLPSLPSLSAVKQRRQLKGHQSKVTCMEWSREGNRLVSAAQDGTLIVWEPISTAKLAGIALQSMWVMACALAPSNNFAACGGLDNTCSIYNLQSEKASTPVRQFTHEGSLGGCKFVDDKQILTGAGDMNCSLWDIESSQKTTEFVSHHGGINALALSHDQKTFLSAGCDASSKLWDFRQQSPIFTFSVKGVDDINCVTFSNSGKFFVAGDSNGVARLYDIRVLTYLNEYKGDFKNVNGVALSKSSRFLFLASDSGPVKVFDTLKADVVGDLALQNTPNPTTISAVGVSSDGRAVAATSFDNLVRIWA